MKRIIVLLMSILTIIYLPAPVYAVPLAQAQALAGMIVPAADLEGLQLTAKSTDKPKEQTVVSRSDGSADYQQIIKTARAQLGKKYRYGGEGPNYFDCSGFTMFVFRQAGIDLPHSAADQAGYGVHVDKGDLRPGDLVFFSYYKGKNIEHAGIYIGNGDFIHASSSNNMAVIISSLNQQYYIDNYKGARRLLR